MTDINVRFRVTKDGVEIIDQAGESMGKFGDTAKQAGSGFQDAGNKLAQFGLQAIGITSVLGAIKQGLDFAGELNDIGEKSLLAKTALQQFAGAQSTEYISKMQAATKFLADDTDLAKDATFALSAGLVKSSGEMATLAHMGAELGRVFKGGDIQGGIEALMRAEEMPGQARGLKELGFNIAAVKDEFEKLKATGMDEHGAWIKSINDNFKEIPGSLDGTGTALKRLQVQFEDFKESVGEGVAVNVELLVSHPVEATVGGFVPGTANVVGQNADLLSKAFTYQQNQLAKSVLGNQLQAGPTSFGAIASPGDVGTSPFYGPVAQPGGSGTMSQAAFDAGAANMSGNLQNARYGLQQTFGNVHLENLQKEVQVRATLAEWVEKASHAQSELTAGAQRILGPLAEQTRLNVENAQALEKAHGQTVQQITGGKQNTLAGDVFGGMDAAEQARIKSLPKGKQDQALAEYKKAQDEIALATGQVTERGLKARDIQEALGSSYAKGAISLKQYTTELMQYYHALEQGKDLQDVEHSIWLNDPKQKRERQYDRYTKLHGTGDPDDPTGTGGGATGGGAAKVEKLNNELDTTTGKAATAGAAIANIPGPSSALTTASNLLGMLQKIGGTTYVANVQIKTSGSVPTVNSAGDRF